MLKVYISHGGFDAMMAGPQILIVEILPDGTRRVAQPITLAMVPMLPGRRVEPTIDLGDYELNEQFVQALADAIQERKTPTKNDHTIGGKLDATERHLEDLQILLNLKPKRTA